MLQNFRKDSNVWRNLQSKDSSMEFPSKLIGNAVEEFSRLPGIGKKTALRLTLHLLKLPVEDVQHFGLAITTLREKIQYCKTCFNISDDEICSICANKSRKQDLVCIVESMRDVLAIENTQNYNGVYHVLGGVISPLEGIGPEKLKIDALFERIKTTEINEIIMALSPTMEGDTTVFYITKKLNESPNDIKITTLARGVAFGGELQYVDEVTLSRALVMRRPYESSI